MMITGRLGMLAAVLGVVAAVAGQGAIGQPSPAAWLTMTGPESSFTAEMPIAPQYTTTPMRTSSGSNYTMHQYVAEVGATAYVAQTAIYPEDVKVANPRANLQGGLDNAARNMTGGKWASIAWVAHQGLTAVEAVGERDGLAIRSYSLMKGRRIVTLTYAGPLGSARSAEADRFIASLRVGGP